MQPNSASFDLTGRETLELVRFAIIIAVGEEEALRVAAHRMSRSGAPRQWVEELVLQSYLFVGFPRGLNAAREWRRASGAAAPEHDDGERTDLTAEWRARGEITCEIVYGSMYERLRSNIRSLHPALDAWMIVEGYGKVLGRPGLDLARRELCIVATCAVLRQERQLHAHLHGALHSGASPQAVDAVLSMCGEWLHTVDQERFLRLWERVRSRS